MSRRIFSGGCLLASGGCLLALTGTLFAGITFVVYPFEKENVGAFDYCYAFEKLVSRNIFKQNDMPNWIKTISATAMSAWADNSRGALVKAAIEEDSNSNPEIFCLTYYWIEKFNPGGYSLMIQEELINAAKETVGEGVQEFLDAFTYELFKSK